MHWINSIGGRILSEELKSYICQGIGFLLELLTELPYKQDAQTAYQAQSILATYAKTVRLRLLPWHW
ncbi:hypothetical protein PMIT1303_00108 [Prochlorococcus sp. MIT 1303]|nr:hypothetical protein PMIT1303_00108 [Prochlorococcus sp. MIT 1303]